MSKKRSLTRKLYPYDDDTYKNIKNSTKKISTKATINLILIGTALIAVAGFVVYFLLSMIIGPAKIGVMNVESSGVDINPISNTLEISNNEKEESFDALVLEDIIEEIPIVEYGGDITVNYSEPTLDNFTFSMYSEDGESIYKNYDYFEHPTHAGTYIFKVKFSWGQRKSDTILTENYFKVHYDDVYQSCDGCGSTNYHH